MPARRRVRGSARAQVGYVSAWIRIRSEGSGFPGVPEIAVCHAGKRQHREERQTDGPERPVLVVYLAHLPLQEDT